MATHPSIISWRIPWREEPGSLQSMCGHKESDRTEQLSTAQHKLSSVLSSLFSWEPASTKGLAETC